MNDPFAKLAQARRLATGSQLEAEPPNGSPKCMSEAEFERLITEYYKFYCEDITIDVSFLTQIRSSKETQAFRRLLYDLRTSSNHTDNPAATTATKEWRNQFDSPQSAADALAESMSKALAELGTIAVEVSRRAEDAARWREILSVDAGTVFASVEVDLGLRFAQGNRKRMIRLVQKRLEVRPVQGDRRTVVAEYCLQEMISDRRPLPVPYDQVLDTLGLLGTPEAVGGILTAYSVASISPGLSADDFLERVLLTWRAAAAR